MEEIVQVKVPSVFFGALSVRIHDDSCFAAHAVVAAGSSYA
jgi:hypothetical protein